MTGAQGFRESRCDVFVESLALNGRMRDALVAISGLTYSKSLHILISPLPRLPLARCPLIPILLRLCASLSSLFFRIIGVSLTGTGTTASLDRSSMPLIDFRVLRTNGPVGGPILGPLIDDEDVKGCRGGEEGRMAEGRGRWGTENFKKSTWGSDLDDVGSEGASARRSSLSVREDREGALLLVIVVGFDGLTGGGGESD